jgi:hypothetical protein
VTDKQDGSPFFRNVSHLSNALPLEIGIADGQDFVHQQDFRLEVGSNGKR